MKKESIFFKINILYLTSIILTIFAYILAINYQIYSQNQKDFSNLRFILQELKNEDKISPELLDMINAKVVPSILIDDIIKRGKKSFQRYKYGVSIVSIMLDNKHYFLITKKDNKILLYFEKSYKNIIITTIVFAIFMVFLVSIFTLLKKNLKPLKDLEKDIKNYAQGAIITPKFIDRDDEVAKINNAFYEYATKTQALSNARKLFIRNIFHELNTPVTKGKLLAEITKDESTKKMLTSIFNRLSFLLQDLAQIEQIVSKEYNLNISQIPVIELIDQAKDLLYIKNLKHNITNQTIEGDFKLLSIVFKNLIDNAIKYGKNLEIKASNGEICFISQGEKLPNDLHYYTQPFTTTNKNRGFGLGLYIVKEILDMHNMHFIYKYQDNKNYFCIRYLI